MKIIRFVSCFITQILPIMDIGEWKKIHKDVYYRQIQEIEWEIRAVGFTLLSGLTGEMSIQATSTTHHSEERKFIIVRRDFINFTVVFHHSVECLYEEVWEDFCTLGILWWPKYKGKCFGLFLVLFLFFLLHPIIMSEISRSEKSISTFLWVKKYMIQFYID